MHCWYLRNHARHNILFNNFVDRSTRSLNKYINILITIGVFFTHKCHIDGLLPLSPFQLCCQRKMINTSMPCSEMWNCLCPNVKTFIHLYGQRSVAISVYLKCFFFVEFFVHCKAASDLWLRMRSYKMHTYLTYIHVCMMNSMFSCRL